MGKLKEFCLRIFEKCVGVFNHTELVPYRSTNKSTSIMTLLSDNRNIISENESYIEEVKKVKLIIYKV